MEAIARKLCIRGTHCSSYVLRNSLNRTLLSQAGTQDRKVGVSKAQENKGLVDVQPVRGTKPYMRGIEALPHAVQALKLPHKTGLLRLKCDATTARDPRLWPRGLPATPVAV